MTIQHKYIQRFLLSLEPLPQEINTVRAQTLNTSETSPKYNHLLSPNRRRHKTYFTYSTNYHKPFVNTVLLPQLYQNVVFITL
jgi:hypothetical protein